MESFCWLSFCIKIFVSQSYEPENMSSNSIDQKKKSMANYTTFWKFSIYPNSIIKKKKYPLPPSHYDVSSGKMFAMSVIQTPALVLCWENYKKTSSIFSISLLFIYSKGTKYRPSSLLSQVQTDSYQRCKELHWHYNLLSQATEVK